MTELVMTVNGVPLLWVGRVLYAGRVPMGKVSPPWGESDPHGFIAEPAFRTGGEHTKHGDDEDAAKGAVIADAIRALSSQPLTVQQAAQALADAAGREIYHDGIRYSPKVAKAQAVDF